MASFVPRVEQCLHDFQLPFVVRDITAGDGNCFFRAIIQCMRDHNDQTFNDHMHVRKELVHFIATNRLLQQNEQFRVARLHMISQKRKENEMPGMTWTRILFDMSQNGTWAEDLFITCTAQFLHRDIKITSCQQSRQFPWLTFKPIVQPLVWKPPLTLAMIPQVHFQCLSRSLGNTNVCLGCGQHCTFGIRRHLGQVQQCKDFYDRPQLARDAAQAAKDLRKNRKVGTETRPLNFDDLHLPFLPIGNSEKRTKSFVIALHAALEMAGS